MQYCRPMKIRHFIWSQQQKPPSTHLLSRGERAVLTLHTNTLRFHSLHRPPVRVQRRKTLTRPRGPVRSLAVLLAPAKESGLFFCGHNRKPWDSFWKTDRVCQLIFQARQQHPWDKSLAQENGAEFNPSLRAAVRQFISARPREQTAILKDMTVLFALIRQQWQPREPWRLPCPFLKSRGAMMKVLCSP